MSAEGQWVRPDQLLRIRDLGGFDPPTWASSGNRPTICTMSRDRSVQEPSGSVESYDMPVVVTVEHDT